ncbi:MAG: GvpL/GvpF family gas vesicle protein [Deltaproteobacteria bacterium]|nr:GvpL/GvpF family gas vesicle protein [Deltaproteobacteria bacterium]
MIKKVTNIPARNGRYMYAIIPGAQERSFGSIGINGAKVYTICVGEAAAVVSDAPNGKIRPERRNFAAHQAVLKTLVEEGDLLPMSFGNISSNGSAVKDFLAKNNSSISKALKRISGKIEMGLRVNLDVPNIFEYLVTTYDELRIARDELIRPNREPSQDDKIELGRLFQNILDSARDQHFETVSKSLAVCCSEIKKNKCRDEREVMNLACLINRGAVEKFEDGVFKAASLFDDNFAFDYNGPWAPHNFVDLEIK